MTGPDRRARQPGTLLLKIGRIVFSPSVFETVVMPTVADLRREVADAGSGRAPHMRALWRGYRAFWTLVLLGPFLRWNAVTGQAAAESRTDAFPRLWLGLLTVVVVGSLVAVMGIWSAGLALASALVALSVHAWYARHPSVIPTLAEPSRRWPEINYSSTDVEGNIGGLIFLVGTILIVAVALPTLLWFLAAESLGGGLVAWALVVWHASQSRSGARKAGIGLH